MSGDQSETHSMTSLGQVLATVWAVVAFSATPAADPMPDLSKVDRSVRNEPTFVAKQPLYGLAVFSPKADKPVWLVLDKSEPDGKSYDVLHWGSKRYTAKDGVFTIGNLTDPATAEKHNDVSVRLSKENDDAGPTVML